MTKETAEFLLNVAKQLNPLAGDPEMVVTAQKIMNARRELEEILKQS